MHQLKRTIVCLRISMVLYAIVAGILILGFFILDFNELPQPDRSVVIGTVVATLALVIGIIGFVEKVIRDLRRRKFWAWTAALILCGLYLPSIFMPLGAIGLSGLLSGPVKAEFGIRGRKST